MSLCRSPAYHSVLCRECGKTGLVDLASLNSESSNDFVVGSRNVACACGLCNVRILELCAVFVDVCEFKSVSVKRSRKQRCGNILRSGACADGVTAEDVKIDFRVYAVVLADEDRESAENVL